MRNYFFKIWIRAPPSESKSNDDKWQVWPFLNKKFHQLYRTHILRQKGQIQFRIQVWLQDNPDSDLTRQKSSGILSDTDPQHSLESRETSRYKKIGIKSSLCLLSNKKGPEISCQAKFLKQPFPSRSFLALWLLILETIFFCSDFDPDQTISVRNAGNTFKRRFSAENLFT